MLAAGLKFALLFQIRDAPARTRATVAGRLTDNASGQPLARRMVTLLTADRSRVVEVLTDADGRYQFKAAPPGKYGVFAQNDEHRSTYLPQWFSDTDPANIAGFAVRLALDLAPGESRLGVDVAVTRAPRDRRPRLRPLGRPDGRNGSASDGPERDLHCRALGCVGRSRRLSGVRIGAGALSRLRAASANAGSGIRGRRSHGDAATSIRQARVRSREPPARVLGERVTIGDIDQRTIELHVTAVPKL